MEKFYLFNTPVKDLSGKDIVTETGEKVIIGKQVANMIVADSAKENILHRFEVAQKLADETVGEIHLTDSEKEIIKEVCKSGRMTVLLSAQVLKILDS